MIDDLANNVFVQIAMLAGATLLLVWVSWQRDKRQREQGTTLPPSPARTTTNRSASARPQERDEPVPALPAAQWLPLVNDRPEEIAHLAIFGPSGSGKTTLCQGILAARDGQVIVIDPKPPRPGQTKWGGMPYVRIDTDGSYRTIDTTLQRLRREVNTRLAALEAGQVFPPLTIVLDEYKALVRECPDSAPDLLLRVSDIGRELGMRLVILSQSRGVAALGVQGQGDTRENFVTISVDKQHRATLLWDEESHPLVTAPVIAQAQRAIPAERWWQPADTAVPPAVRSNPPAAVFTSPAAPTDLRAEAMQALLDAGWTPARIDRALAAPAEPPAEPPARPPRGMNLRRFE